MSTLFDGFCDDAALSPPGDAPTAVAARARAAATSTGTCRVLEPVDDLLALGLLATRERTPA